jgi:hypothetical protein
MRIIELILLLLCSSCVAAPTCPQCTPCVPATVELTPPVELLQPCAVPKHQVDTNSDLLNAYLLIHDALWECAARHNHLAELYNKD